MKRFTTILFVMMAAGFVYAQAVTDYLITGDIGSFKQITKGGPRGNVLAGVDHFGWDHKDICYGISYVNDTSKVWIDVQVTQNANSGSDKWLLHELDLAFRNYYGIPGYYLKNIDGNTVYVYGAGGRDYRWLSGDKVVEIEYHDSQLTKPEPLEVIQAYLAKYPSTLPAITMKELYSKTSKTTWIKDEMDRRLWLCDKWFMQLQLKKAEEKDVFRKAVKSMNVFLNYREKYYGIKAADEKNLLDGYLSQDNGTGIKAKLAEYKNWWTVNKVKAISL